MNVHGVLVFAIPGAWGALAYNPVFTVFLVGFVMC